MVMKSGDGNSPYITVVIPCYNEDVAIGSIVLRSLKYADKVLVIDDGSKDKTREVAKLAGAEVIIHDMNIGKGACIKDAFEYVKNDGTGILVIIDGDGQHNPDEIPILIEPILKDEADIVNGSRFLSNNGNKVPGYRRVGQEVLTVATNTGTGLKITDTQNGFRAFSKKTFDSFNFNQQGMAIESEMLIEAAGASLRIMEVPINVRYDVDGSTLNPISHGIGVLNPILGLISQKRPLLFFGAPGFLMLIIASIFCFLVLEAFNRTMTVAIGYSMIFMLFTILGIFSIFTGLMLWSIQNIRQR
jgi:glycosyltransferase involved in cell wall biosynthesis